MSETRLIGSTRTPRNWPTSQFYYYNFKLFVLHWTRASRHVPLELNDKYKKEAQKKKKRHVKFMLFKIRVFFNIFILFFYICFGVLNCFIYILFFLQIRTRSFEGSSSNKRIGQNYFVAKRRQQPQQEQWFVSI